MILESFEDAVAKLQGFLEKCGQSREIAWVRPEDVLLTGRQVIYVRMPLSESGPAKARQAYEEGLKQGRGVRLETFCEFEGATLCHVWVPKDDLDASYAMMGGALKLSVRTDKITARPVNERIHWMWLNWWHRHRQNQKDWIFQDGLPAEFSPRS